MVKVKKRKYKYDFMSVNLLRFIWQKRKPLLVIAGSAFVVSLIVSLLITPRFRASVVMFPSAGVSVAKSVISDGYGSSGISEIGDEEQAENLIQMLNSGEIRKRVSRKFDLMNHYRIDPDSRYAETKLNARYKSNVRFKRTPYRSVVIEVTDTDPGMAADIANEIAILVDTVYHNLIRQRAMEAFKLIEKEHQIVIDNIHILQDSLTKIRKLGINHYESQAERYYEAYAKAIAEGNSQAANALESRIRILSEYGGQYVYLRDQIGHETVRLNRMKQKYTELKLELEQNLPNKFIVNSADKPEKKIYPRRSLLIVSSVLSACLLGLFLLILLDNLRIKFHL